MLMLDAAIGQLLEDPTVAISSIGFEETAAMVAVPRSTAYRTFAVDGVNPSQVFQDAIAERIIDRTRLGLVPEELAALPQLAETLAEAIPQQSREASMLMLRNLVRKFCNAIFDSYSTDPYASLILSVQLRSNGSDALNAAIAESIEKSRSAFIDFFSALASSFDAELQPGWTWSAFSAAAGNPLAGHIINRFASGGVSEVELPTGRDRSAQRWTMFAVGVWGLLMTAWKFPTSGSDPN